MKVRSALGVLILTLACQMAVGAQPIEATSAAKSNKLSSEQIAWPMLPGENLKNLSVRFFPDDEDIQQIFIEKTIKLNAKTIPDLNAEVFFTSPKAILIPKPNTMRSGIHPIRPAVIDDPSLQYSYGFDTSSLQEPKQRVRPVALPDTDTDGAQRWLTQTIWAPIVAFCSDLSIDNAKEKLFGNPAGTGGISLMYQQTLEYFSEQDPLRLLLWLVAASAFLLGVYLPVRAKRIAQQLSPLTIARTEPIFTVEEAQHAQEPFVVSTETVSNEPTSDTSSSATENLVEKQGQ